MIKEEESLWNITKNKLSKVRKYIDALEPNRSWGIKAVAHFERIKNIALTEMNSNKALKIIGYSFNHKPKLYYKCAKMN